MTVRHAIAALGILAAALLPWPEAVSAQQKAENPEGFPPNTVVARFQIDPAILMQAETSGELIALLREHLTIDVGMPLGEPLSVMPRGYAGDRDGGMVYHFGLSSLGLRVASAGQWEDMEYAMAVRESHGDDFPPDGDMWDEIDSDEEWDEDAAWASLVETLDVGLPQSADGFERPMHAGTLPLRVVAVHFIAWDDHETEERLGGPMFRFQPDPYYGSSMEGEPLEFDGRTILIQLAPRD